MARFPFRHVVVAGASMAGLLAARVLSDHFEHVTLVERDALPRQPETRKGVPQGRHLHILLMRGRSALEGLFPGITDELRAAGAVAVKVGRDLAWHHAGDWRVRYDGDLWLLALSRPLLEAQVGARLRSISNVQFRAGVRLQAITIDKGSVTAVSLATGRKSETLECDLVVDATGRGSALPRWLAELGLPAVPMDTIPVPVTYATCLFPRGDGCPDWRALLITNPGARRAAFTLAIEGRRWLVTLANFFDEPAPRDHAAFLSAAEAMPVSTLYDAISGLEPLSNIVLHRFPGSQRRRYERVRSFPAGLIAIGDAVCSFNPVYGQGMTVAAVEAEALERVLGEARRAGRLDAGFARGWFGEIGRIIDVAWQGASIEDFRFPEVSAYRPTSLRPLQWYMNRVHRATHDSELVADQFYRVIGFVDSPKALFRPRVIANTLFAAQPNPAGRQTS